MMARVASAGQTYVRYRTAVLMSQALRAKIKAHSSNLVKNPLGSKHHTSSPRALALYLGTG